MHKTTFDHQCWYCEAVFEDEPVKDRYGQIFCSDDCMHESESSTNEDTWYDDAMYGESIDGVGFADPGGESALRAETEDNPRNLPCPTCREPDRLTPIDVQRGYHCDACARSVEMGF